MKILLMLETTFFLKLVRMFDFMISRPNLIMGHVGLKHGILGQIGGKSR